jgi:hypothetical protein
MGSLLFWLGIGAAQKSAGSKPMGRRNRALSLAVGSLVGLLIAVGMFVLLVSQQTALIGLAWGYGFQEQIFGADEQGRSRGQTDIRMWETSSPTRRSEGPSLSIDPLFC